MGLINTGLLTRDARSEFLNRFDEAQRRTIFQDICTRIASNKDTENYRWLGTVPQMREWGSGRQAKGLRSEAYDVANLKYEATLEVDRDELSDDQTGQIMIRIGELAQRAATHKDYLIGQLLENGASAGFNSYDGVTFFNAAHVSGASGNQDNARTFNVTTPADPTSAEFKAAMAVAIQALLGFKDDQGQPLNLGESALRVIVPPNMYYAALEAVNATIISNTSNVMAGRAMVTAFPWLTSTDKFYVLKTDGVVRPFVFQDREPIEFKSLAEGSEEEFRREKYLYGVRARYRLTYGYWQYAVRVLLN